MDGRDAPRQRIFDGNYGDYSVSVKVYNYNILLSLSVTNIFGIKFAYIRLDLFRVHLYNYFNNLLLISRVI